MDLLQDTRDRVIAVERDVAHLKPMIEGNTDKIDAIHSWMLETRGQVRGAGRLVAFAREWAPMAVSMAALVGVYLPLPR
jgi:hypothetical protein